MREPMAHHRLAAIAVAAIFVAVAAYGGCPTITPGPANLTDATLGQPYSQLLTVTGATPPYSFALVPGSTLPQGIRLFSDHLIGTPTQAGVYMFKIQATDSNNCTGISQYTLKVIDPSVPTCQAMVISPSSL